MSIVLLYRLSGLSLALGGLFGSAAHILHPVTPSDPGALLHYAHVSEPAHLLLFLGVILVLLGLPGLLARQSPRAGLTGLAGFLFLFFGLLFADMLHCILEFSILPVLARSVPYATFSIVEATYSATPLALLQNIGQLLVFLGIPLMAYSIYRARVFPLWTAVPLLLSLVLLVSSYLPLLSGLVGPHGVTSLYLAFGILGGVLVRGRLAERRTQEVKGRISLNDTQTDSGISARF